MRSFTLPGSLAQVWLCPRHGASASILCTSTITSHMSSSSFTVLPACCWLCQSFALGSISALHNHLFSYFLNTLFLFTLQRRSCRLSWPKVLPPIRRNSSTMLLTISWDLLPFTSFIVNDGLLFVWEGFNHFFPHRLLRYLFSPLSSQDSWLVCLWGPSIYQATRKTCF